LIVRLLTIKPETMKNIIFLLTVCGIFIFYSCEKDKRSERFKLLTAPTWNTDTLYANGVDASGTGGLLEKFKGEARFNEDGTGKFGLYEGKWRFNTDETELTITTDSLPLPVISKIKELTALSLKITTVVPNLQNPQEPFSIRMTFKAK
jgi:hypothetical protein